jgi:hypothetical protein
MVRAPGKGPEFEKVVDGYAVIQAEPDRSLYIGDKAGSTSWDAVRESYSLEAFILLV